MSEPVEGPEYNTDSLSPVSPKPVHYHSPASVPVLENQMDPIFNDTATHAAKADSAIGTASDPSHQSSAATIPGPVQTNIDRAGDADADMEDVTYSADQSLADVPEIVVNGFQTVSTNGLAENSNDHSNSETQDAHATNPQSQPGTAPLATMDPLPYDPFADADSVIPQATSSTDPSQVESAFQRPHDTAVAGAVTPSANGVNYQALLDTINASAFASTAPAADNLTATVSQTTATSPPQAHAQIDEQPNSALTQSPLTSPSAGSGLPARPPPQLALPFRTVSADVSANKAFDPSSDLQPPNAASAVSYAPLANAAPPPLLTAGAPGTSSATGSSGLPPPPIPGFQQPIPTSATLPRSAQAPGRQASSDADQLGPKEDENIKWGQDTQQAYDEFLEAERKYVLEGKWENFPAGSRLFLGNLSSERVTKRDLFHVFHKYGKLAQLSIKSNFGFAQFLTAKDCSNALKHEQDVRVRGRQIHLEISKPARNSRNAAPESRSAPRRRSPSPDRGRGSRNGTFDRYDGGNGRMSRAQDNWRPTRSRSPGPRRWSQERFRQRSRTPPSRARYREDDEASLPMPPRPPHQVPEVQILVKGQLDRNFVDYVKRALWAKGLKLDEMFLGERVNEEAVKQRQILEGVLGVMRLTPMEQHRQMFQVTIFDRSQGQGNVRYDEYTNLSLDICVGLLDRAKQQARPSYSMPGPPVPSPSMMQPKYGWPPPPASSPGIMQPNRGFPPPLQGQFHSQQNYGGPSPTAPVPGSLTGMDSGSLQQLLANVQRSQSSPQTPQQPQYPTPGGYNQTQPPYPQRPQQPPQQHQNYASPMSMPSTGYGQAPLTPNQHMYQQQPQQPSQQKTPDISTIMAQLGKYSG